MTQKHLLGRYLKDIQPGRLDWIGVRPARKRAVVSLDSVMALEGLGLEGDHRCFKTAGSARQVTLISAEAIAIIATYTGRQVIDPALLRRNLVVSGINLNLLRHQRFRIGAVLFEGTALCHPCSRMDNALGQGGAAAMYGFGGLCARILETGVVSVADKVVPELV